MGGAWIDFVPVALAGAALLALFRTAALRRRAPGAAPLQRLGILLLAAPLLTLLLVGASAIPSLLDPGSIAPLTPDRLADKTIVHLGLYLLTPLVGFILVAGPKRAVAIARDRLLPDGSRPDALASALSAASSLSLLLVGAVTLAWGLGQTHDGGLFSASGARVVFSQVTPGLALLLAGVAALAEEGLFRGIVLDQLDGLVSRSGAIGIQAVLFGLIHAGYGSLPHVLAATAFGVAMGVLVTRRGLLPAIVTHFLVNVAILGLWAGHAELLVFVALALVGMALAAWWLRRIPDALWGRSPAGSA